MSTKIATFGAGCFWGVEYSFRKIDGVLEAFCGYEGGDTENPTYKDVCTGTTNHAEVVEVHFNPEKVDFLKLLDAFFTMHNPTEKNKQGPDVGTQYRSIIFYHSEEQKQQAQIKINELEDTKKFALPIATKCEPSKIFYKAEEYHQRYFEKNPNAACNLHF